MLDQLGEAGPMTATQLAARFPVSRQAVVKHLSALSEAGLVTSARNGREVRYHVAPCSLDDAVSWLVTAGRRWDRRLAALGEHLAGRPAPPERLPAAPT